MMFHVRWWVMLVVLVAACTQTPTPVIVSEAEATNMVVAPTATISSAGQTPRDLRLGITTTLAPNVLSSTAPVAEMVQSLVYETLVTYTDSGDLQPLLAAALPAPSDDYLSWSVTTRTGIKFYDDTPLAPQEIVAALERILQTDTNDAHSVPVAAFQNLVDSITVHESTIVFRLKQPFLLFPQLLAEQQLAIKSISGAGTGPFMPSQAGNTGATLTLTANDNYWNGSTALSKVQIHALASQDAYETIIQLLYDESLDMVTLAPCPELPPELPDEYLVNHHPTRQRWLVFNRHRYPLNQMGVRAAVSTTQVDRNEAYTLLTQAGLPDGFDMVIWSAIETTEFDSVSLPDLLPIEIVDVQHVGPDHLVALLTDSNNGTDATARNLPAALLVDWVHEWEGSWWVGIAGSDAPNHNPLTVINYWGISAGENTGCTFYRTILSNLEVTSSGWPRVTMNTTIRASQ